MTHIKTRGKWAVAILLALAIALFAFSLPAYAADEATPPDAETEASVSFTAGELKLVTAPVLDFGSHDISPTAQSYTAEAAGPNVQISDLRGSGAGWNLMVSLSEFQLSEGGGATLQAASITTSGLTVKAVNGTVGAPPAAEAEVTLTSDNTETPIWSAASGAGMGVWDLQFNPANTKLNVKPGTAQKGKSVATLTWSLQSTP